MINDILQFSSFLDAFRKVERGILVNGTDRQESDIDHSYMLAMLGWYICTKEKLSLDVNKVIHYSLVHDLVEVYAGDTHFYNASAEDYTSKERREQAAMKRIIKEFPHFTDLPILIKKYHKKADAESRFVYALDKVQPVLMIYLDRGRTWRKDGISYAMLREKKDPKVAIDPIIKKYWDELVLLLKKDVKNFPDGRK
jgi:putative hydrolase of HD superfamily